MRSLVTMLLLVGCGGDVYVNVPGAATPMLMEQSAGAQVQSLSHEAAKDLGCATVTVAHKFASPVLLAEGCSKLAYYLRVIEGDDVKTVTFAPLATATPMMPLVRGRAALQALLRINEVGARDLACPPGEVFPELVSSGRGAVTPVAEGCGKRATYLAASSYAVDLRLVARVDTATVTAAGFDAWDGTGNF